MFWQQSDWRGQRTPANVLWYRAVFALHLLFQLMLSWQNTESGDISDATNTCCEAMAEQTLLRRTLQEVNIRGKQYDSHHSSMVPGGSRLETNSCCAQYCTLCSWHAVQLKGNVLQILSQFWEKLLLAEPPLNPNPRIVWGTCQQECTQHDSRIESFKPSVDQDKVRWKQAHAQWKDWIWTKVQNCSHISSVAGAWKITTGRILRDALVQVLWHRGGTLAPPLDQPTYSLRTSQEALGKLHVPTQAHHDAFLPTTALMSGPLL